MADLEFYQLGNDLEAETIRIQNLYLSDEIDDSIRSEFGPTVESYTTLSHTDLMDRVSSKYFGENSDGAGWLATVDGIDVGMAAWAIRDFKYHGQEKFTRGINASAWLLKSVRGAGFGNKIIAHATEDARIAGDRLQLQVWTSIRPENIASRRACESAGFRIAGIHGNLPDRRLYLLEN